MKTLKNLGNALTKAEQKTINGGGRPFICAPDSPTVCPHRSMCREYAPGQWDCNG